MSTAEPDQSQSLVIGINGGGTRTTFALVDDALNVLARAETGPSNVNYVGVEAATEALREGIAAVLGDLPLSRVMALGAGLAGVDRPSDVAQFRQIFAEICPGVPAILDNDAVGALVAGVGRRFGIVTISGTGMIALGLDGSGDRARSGGWGHYVDHGSGYAIARDTLTAIASAYDGSGPETQLTGRVLSRLGLETPEDLITWLYVPDRRIDQIAAIAADTTALAAEGDRVAVRIIAHAADALANATIAVAHRLHFSASDPLPVLMSGGLFTYSALLRDLFSVAVQTAIPNAAPFLTDRDAAFGAALMALEAHTGSIDLPDHLSAGAQTIRRRRATEQRHPLTMHAGQMTTLDFIATMNLLDEHVPGIVGRQLPQIAALIDAAADRFEKGGRILLVGAGTSGRLAVLDAAECRPTFGVTPTQVVGILAGGQRAMLEAVEGAEDDDKAGYFAIAERNVGALDSVIGVAASGSTPFVYGALQEAIKRGALTGCIVNVMDAPISEIVGYPIVLPTGPEALTGSTRLKAGTAQKLVLNMISTGIMRRVGRMYHNLMTDMQAGNVKLRERATRIVAEATGLDLDAASTLLTRCNNEMKTAIASALLRISPEQARSRLAEMHGNLNRLLAQ